jgi:hypothetical protein
MTAIGILFADKMGTGGGQCRASCRCRFPALGLASNSSTCEAKEAYVPRYIVERSFPDGLLIPMNSEGTAAYLAIVERNAAEGVTWMHSYLSDDRARSFCVYEAPTPEAIRTTGARNKLPVERITAVRVLVPYFYWEES